MKDLLEYIVKNLVNNPDAVEIQESSEGQGIVNLSLKVSPEDMGIIIGKGGATIHALRKILTVRAIAENVKVFLHLEDQNSDQSQESRVKEETSQDEDNEKSTEETKPEN